MKRHEPKPAAAEIVWQPARERMGQSNLGRFMQRHGLRSLQELQQRSTTDIAWFWDAILKDLDIRFRRPYSRVVDLSRGMAWPEWCVGGEMNILDSCLNKYTGTPTDQHIALRWEGEEGSVRTLTYQELRREVGHAANALRALGLGKSDVVGVFMPMTPEIVISMLAIIKIGGIFLPLFSGFGPQAIVSRLADAEAKALFTADGCVRRGKVVALKPVADEAAGQLASLRHLIVLRRTGQDVPWTAGRDHWWHDLIGSGAGFQPASPGVCEPRDLGLEARGGRLEARSTNASEPMDPNDPLMILYTSGTTGRPKGAVHTHCGFPIKAAQDIKQGLNLQADETLYWVTDMGWMMGPWLVFGTQLLGATMMLYDGAPDFPGPDRLWALVERHRITTLGLSPTLVRALIRFGEAPVRQHDLSSLRRFGSTGEPWNPDPWLWLFHTVGGGRLPIINYSGGTEISGGILMGNELTPIKPCAFAGPVPGMAADVLDERGNSVRGQVGELVLRQPWMGMTRGFWRDPQRYLDTYWSRFPDVWVHGDWATVDSDGLWYILGRSDDTIKVAGKRIGPAEVESVLVGHPAVSEAAAIGVPDELKGEALICFCVLKSGHAPVRLLAEGLITRVAAALGKPLTPHRVFFVSDLPKTRNGKIMRRVIRAAYLREDPGDVSSLENPASLEAIQNSSEPGPYAAVLAARPKE